MEADASLATSWKRDLRFKKTVVEGRKDGLYQWRQYHLLGARKKTPANKQEQAWSL
jgi:hypothetical protein